MYFLLFKIFVDSFVFFPVNNDVHFAYFASIAVVLQIEKD